MNLILQKLPFLIEILFNGIFVVAYTLKHFLRINIADQSQLLDLLLQVGTFSAPLVIFFVLMINYLSSNGIDDFFRRHVFSIFVFFPLIITWGDQQFAFFLCAVHLLSTIMMFFDSPGKEIQRKRLRSTQSLPTILERFANKPAQAVLLSFLTVCFAGAFFLMLPLASKNSEGLGIVDAIFIATSATCVTGLSTVSVIDTFSLFGQLIILILIQIGGIGIMILYSSMTILLGKSVAMKERLMMQDLLELSDQESLSAMIIDIVKYSLLIELWGALVLTIGFTFEDMEFGQALYYGFFHSISAFCNAGFSLFNTSMESYATNPIISLTISALITLGGLGFIVLKEIKEIILRRRSLVRLTLHSKIVFSSSLFLTISGTIFIFFGEYLNALDQYGIWDKLLISFFQSTTLRTAGFNSIPLTSLHSYTIYLMTMYMFIGASPGSTGGGIKTTTLAILFQSIRSTLKGREGVSMYNRLIPQHLVVKTIAISFISIFITSMAILLMMKLEPNQTFISIMFEVISASGTVGLSLGITPYLTTFGKLAISVVMLIGRTGPLTLVLAIGDSKDTNESVEYPSGRIMIG